MDAGRRPRSTWQGGLDGSAPGTDTGDRVIQRVITRFFPP
jgi:hypothetical protein